MRTFRGAGACAAALLVATTLVAGAPAAAAAEPPAAPYTAFTTHFEGFGYIDGSFSYEASRSTIRAFQQNANGYALTMMASTTGHHHSFDLSPPNGTRFEAGRSYPAKTGFYTSDSITVFNVGGDGQGCEGAAATSGTVNVHEAAYDEATGRFTAFAADYLMHCDGTTRTARGEIRFQSGVGYRATDSPDYRLQFGRQPWGEQGTSMQVPVEVNGTVPTTFGAASLTGPNPTAFRITANTCSGNTLSHGRTCALTVTPTATAVGAQTASLTLLEDSVAGKVRRLLSLEGFDARGDRGTFYPLTPYRVLDTRSGQGAPRATVDSGQTVRLQLTGQGGVPVEASTVVLNVTVTEPSGPGYVSLYPTGLTRPTASSLNYGSDSTVTNFAVVTAIPCSDCGSGTGAPSIGVYTSQDSHVIVDIVSFYDDSSLEGGLRFEPVVPNRIADTRAGQGRPSALGPATTATVVAPEPLTGPDVWALATNVTAVQPTAPTFLTVWPAGYSGVGRPNTSNLNPSAGAIVPNAVQTMIGPECGFHVYNNQGSSHVLVDVVGTFYHDPPPSTASASTRGHVAQGQVAAPKAEPLNGPQRA
ncbi:hypothetical protein ABTZ99_17655 [Actinosynnema sp. NPDC002837]